MWVRERGFSLIEAVLALAISVLVVGIPLTVMAAQSHDFARDAARSMHAGQIDGLLAQLDMSAHSSVAIYTPNTCGTGAGDGAPCPSVRFYGMDALGHKHFWGWDYNGTAKQLTQCKSYGNDPEGGCVESGATLSLESFEATPQPVTSIAARYGVAGPPPVEKAMLADKRVVAGNRVMVVNIADAWALRTKHLLPDGAPFDAAILKGAFIPPTLGAPSSSTSNLIFTAPGFPTQTTTVTVQNYGQYLTYLPSAANPWSVSACVNGGTTVATAAPVLPYSGDSVAIAVSPVSAGSCSFTVSTYDNRTASISVQVYQTPVYSLAVSAPAPSWIYANTPMTASFTASNTLQNITGVRPGYWQSSTPVRVSSVTSSCSNSATNWLSSTASVQVRLVAPVTCTETISAQTPAKALQEGDGYAEQIPGYATPVYKLAASVAPQIVRWGDPATLYASAGLILGGAPGVVPSSVPVAVTNSDSGGCGWGPSGWQSSGSLISITTQGASSTVPAMCTFTVSANPDSVAYATVQGSPQDVSLAVDPAPPVPNCTGSFQMAIAGTCYDVVQWVLYCPGMNLWGQVQPCYLPDGTQATSNPGSIKYVYFPSSLASQDVVYNDSGAADCEGFCPSCPLEDWIGGPTGGTVFAWLDVGKNVMHAVPNPLNLDISKAKIGLSLPNAYALLTGPPDPLNPAWSPVVPDSVKMACRPINPTAHPKN